MKRKLFIMLILSIFCVKGFSQLAVTDPGVTAATTTSNSISTITQTINKIMATAQLALLDASIFDNISTSMEILEYIDQIACQTSELKYNYRYMKNFSCLTMLNMKAVTMNINFSSQIINKLFTAVDVTSMSKEGRIKALSDVLAILKQTSAELGDQNIIIRGYLSRKIAQDYLNNSNFQPKPHSVGDRYR
jgi:hypothetical protein